MYSSSPEVNMSEHFLTKGGVVRSVSIIFYSKDYGFLLIDEMRKGFPDPSIMTEEAHILGGKCEMEDPSPIYAGLREVLEELEYTLRSTTSITGSIRVLLDEFENCKKVKLDHCVSEKKKLYNRFYIINIDTMTNEELRSELIDLFLNWRPKDKNAAKGVKRVYFWKRGDPKPVKCTNLLTFLLDNFPPLSKLE